MTRAFWSSSSFVLVTLSFAIFAAPAAAQTTCGEVTCPKGYECKSETLPCTTTCRDGAECPPCEPEARDYCAPLPCSSDSDCDAGMVCYSAEVEECTGGAAPCAKPADGSDAQCPAPEEEECTTTLKSQCVPRWLLPCESAADCGDGFTCEEQENCGCSGSSGSGGGGSSGSEPTPSDVDPVPPSDGDSSEPTPEERPSSNCTCTPSGEFACRVIVTACASDDDCDDGWTCIDNPEGVCSSSSDGTTTCTEADPPRLCAPPYVDLLGGGRGGVSVGDDSEGSATPGSGSNPDSAQGEAAESDSASSGGGCSVGAARSGTEGLLGLAIAALAAALGRRRPRARA